MKHLTSTSYGLRRLAVSAVVIAAAAVGVSGCGGGETASTTTRDASTERDATTTTGSHYGTHGAMAPETATVADIAAMGPGPAVGQTFDGFVGLDVCGRFLELPEKAPEELTRSTGMTFTSQGRFSVTPPTAEVAAHHVTVADLARALDVELTGGKLVFGPDVQPPQIEAAGTTIQLAGATFGPTATCGDTPAELQLWVYTADAVATGNSVRKVLDDPQDVPIVEDGMAFVITVTPESSLPTLPPSALVR